MYHTEQLQNIKEDDEWYTPYKAFEIISKYLPKNKVIWEAFSLNKKIQSKTYLNKLGYKVILSKKDFFKEYYSNTIIVSNPPFSKKKEVFIRLKEIDLPFCLLLPGNVIYTQYIRDIFQERIKDIQLIIPNNKIQYYKINKKGEIEYPNKCSFYSIWICYKCKFKESIQFV